MKKIWTSLILCLMISFSVLGLVACKKGNNIPVESITFEQSSVEFFKGGEKQLDYTILPADAKGFSLKWSSSNDKIASVNYKGKISANNYGEVTITVKEVNSGITASCKVIINDGNLFKIEPNVASMRTSYFVGEKFNPNGLIVVGTYQTGKTRELLNDEYTLSYPEILTENTEVKIFYKELTTSFNVTVEEDYVTGIEVISPPIKTSYFIGETFDPTGMKVALKYASGKTEEIQSYNYDRNPLMYGSNNVKISYDNFETYFIVTIKADTTINTITDLRSAIDKAEVGSSIMISNGSYNLSEPIIIPKSKNLTIFGESENVTLTTSGPALFLLKNDIDDQTTHNTFIANMKLKSSVSNNSIISIDNENSTNNLNNLNLFIITVNFEIQDDYNIINFSSKTEGFASSDIENVNIMFNQCNIYNNGSSETSNNPLIVLNGLNTSEINIKDCNFVTKNNLLYIKDSKNISLNIENSHIESYDCALNIENLLGGEISITKNSYIKGCPSINLTNCSNLNISINQSFLSVYQQKEDLKENISAIFFMSGCQNLNIDIKNCELNVFYKQDTEYVNAICYIVFIQDGISNSSGNNITLTDCIFNITENKYINLEEEQSSVINENYTNI